MGKKNKNEKDIADNMAYSNLVDTPGTKAELSKTAEIRAEIERKFAMLMSSENREKFKNVALKNEVRLKKLQPDVPMYDEDPTNYSELAAIEQDLFIVTSSYREKPDKENEAPLNDLDYYTRAVNTLYRAFLRTSSAETVDVGANTLEKYVVDFLMNLYAALEDGYAKKANAAIQIIKYIYEIGHRYVDFSSEEEREAAVRSREEFLEKTCKGLIAAIDELYTRVLSYRRREENYKNALDNYVSIRERYDADCPTEVKTLISNLGFKGAMNQLPPGDSRRQYLDIMLRLQSSLLPVLMSSMMLESNMRDIMGISDGIDILVFEVRRAFDSSGKVFDFNKHIRTLSEIYEKNMREMREANKRAVARAEQERDTMARLDAIANDPALAVNVADAEKVIRNYDYLSQRNEQLIEDQHKRHHEYEMEKQNKMLELEKRRNEEREQRLKEEQLIKEQMEEIRNQQEEIERIENTVENTDTNDNRIALNA